jgi:hypothetical protein
MATDTYLDLVSDMITETGLNGGNAPSSIENAEGDAAKVCYWIRIADMQIQRERIDWDFLWGREDAVLTPDSAVVPSPSNIINDGNPNTDTALVNSIAKNRLAIIDPNGEAFFPQFLEWNQFSVLYGYESQSPSDYPSYWTIRPDRTILLSEPIQSSDMTCRYEYWRKPIQMRTGTDVSRIPDDFSRLIVLLAKIMYAEHEDAPEVDVGSTAQYDIVFNQMLSVHAPEAEWQRMENSDQFLQVETQPSVLGRRGNW